MSHPECDTVRPLLSAVADREASPEEIRTVETHVATCASCASELAFCVAFARSFAAPGLVLPPSDLTERIARATYARPSWSERLFGGLRPAPVRAALASCLAAGIGFVVWNQRPGTVAVPTETPAPRLASGVADRTPGPVVADRAPVVADSTPAPDAAPAEPTAPAPVAPRATVASARRAEARPNTAVSAPTPAVAPRRVLEPSGAREHGSLIRVAASPAPSAPAGRASRSAAPTGAGASLVASASTGARTLDPASLSTDTPEVAPPPVHSASRGMISARFLAGDDEAGDDSRAQYQAGLNAQSEASRIGGAVVRAGIEAAANRLAVVNAPVTTGNR